jgi:hypothetical protein
MLLTALTLGVGFTVAVLADQPSAAAWEIGA